MADTHPGEVEGKSCLCSIPDMCGAVWWADFHSHAANIEKYGCSHCGAEAVKMVNALHDIVNAKLGRPMKHPADVRWLQGRITHALAPKHAAGKVRLRRVAEPDIAGVAVGLPWTGRESFRVIYLDRPHGRVVGAEAISRGDKSSAAAPLGPVFEGALRRKAKAVILVHNHPSGATTPSNEDLAVTSAAQAEAPQHGLVVQDHLIVANGRAYSALSSAQRQAA